MSGINLVNPSVALPPARTRIPRPIVDRHYLDSLIVDSRNVMSPHAGTHNSLASSFANVPNEHVHINKNAFLCFYLHEIHHLYSALDVPNPLPINFRPKQLVQEDLDVFYLPTLDQWKRSVEVLDVENRFMFEAANKLIVRDPMMRAMSEYLNACYSGPLPKGAAAKVYSYVAKNIAPGVSEANAISIFTEVSVALYSSTKGFCPLMFGSVSYLRDCVHRTRNHVSIHGFRATDSIRLSSDVVGYNAIRTDFLYSNGREDPVRVSYANDGTPVPLIGGRFEVLNIPGGDIPINIFPTPPMVLRAAFGTLSEPLSIYPSAGRLGMYLCKTETMPFVVSDLIQLRLEDQIGFLSTWPTQRVLDESASIAPNEDHRWIVLKNLPRDEATKKKFFIVLCLAFQWYADSILAVFRRFHCDPYTARITAASLHELVFEIKVPDTAPDDLTDVRVALGNDMLG
jgi:hypothetical protein